MFFIAPAVALPSCINLPNAPITDRIALLPNFAKSTMSLDIPTIEVETLADPTAMTLQILTGRTFLSNRKLDDKRSTCVSSFVLEFKKLRIVPSAAFMARVNKGPNSFTILEISLNISAKSFND